MTRIVPEADLAEEAVFLFLSEGRADSSMVAAWRNEKEAFYRLPIGRERDRGFEAHARRWFETLGLAEPVERALRDCPSVLAGIPSVHIRRVVRVRDEGSEVYGPATDVAGRPERMTLGVLPCRFLEPEALESLALREFLHAEDMLDPSFGFRPSLDPEPNPERRDLIRDRFRVLWDARVEGRIARRADPHAAPPSADARFRAAFGRSADPSAVERLHRDAWTGALKSHRSLVDRARDPDASVTAARGAESASPVQTAAGPPEGRISIGSPRKSR